MSISKQQWEEEQEWESTRRQEGEEYTDYIQEIYEQEQREKLLSEDNWYPDSSDIKVK